MSRVLYTLACILALLNEYGKRYTKVPLPLLTNQLTNVPLIAGVFKKVFIYELFKSKMMLM